MNRREFELRLQEVVSRQRLADASWLSVLEEHDEPPLFSRVDEVEFLAALPNNERLSLLLDVAARTLDDVAATIDRLPSAERFFVSLTITDWDDLEESGYHVITPALLVSPDWRREIIWPIGAPSVSAFAKRVEHYYRAHSRGDLLVKERAPDLSQDTPPKVYVGYRSGRHRFRSVGD